jgi:superfamily II DNA or RNA helicase
MPNIIINNRTCRLEDENDIQFLWELDNELSYKIQGAEYSKAFKSKRWDGIKRLLKDDLSFPIGLLGRVKRYYELCNKQFNIIDKRSITPSNPLDISDNLKNLDIEPREYQKQAVEATKNNYTGIIRVATGGGKTLISALIAADINKKTIIYVIGTDLLYQFYNFFVSVFGSNKIGIVGDGKCDIKDINIVSVWTAGQALDIKTMKFLIEDKLKEKKVQKNKYNDIKKMLKETKVHIWDECHIAACDTIQNIYNYIEPEHLYGMSASPWRDDNADMLIECILGTKIVDISAKRLIEEGYLTKPIIKFKKVPKIQLSSTQYQTVYKEYIIENDIRNNIILSDTEKLVSLGYKTIVLFKSINHGNVLYDLISKKLKCKLLNGNDSIEERDKVKKEIESGEIDVVIASRIFDIGVDVPILSGLVVAGSGKSGVATLQRVGRVLRLYPGKTYSAVVDYIDDAKHLSDHSKKRKEILETEFKVNWEK